MWVCPACTFENNVTTQEQGCEICATTVSLAQVVKLEDYDEGSECMVAAGRVEGWDNLGIAKQLAVNDPSKKFGFSGNDFVREAMAKMPEHCKSIEQALVQLQQLIDDDIVHSVPYVKNSVASPNPGQFYQFGRRFFAKAKSGLQSRSYEQCGVCERKKMIPLVQSDTERNRFAVASWVCEICTFENPSKTITIEKDDSFLSTPKSYINRLVRNVAGGDGTHKEQYLAERIRDAIKAAILHSAASCGGLIDPDKKRPELCEFLAVDRSIRKKDGTALLTSYAPKIMKELREIFDIDENFFCSSLFDFPLEMKGGDGGRSGSYFLFSKDRHFVVKSLTKKETKVLRALLIDLYDHCKENPDTLLPRIFGLFKIQIDEEDADEVAYFMVTNNVFDSELSIDRVYDLKGSTAKRWVDPMTQQQVKEATGSLPTLKDLNWKSKMCFRQEHVGFELLQQIKRDASFLAEHDIMDFSLLVGVHEGEVEGQEGRYPIKRSRFQRCFGGIQSRDMHQVYFVSLIDVLQTYDFSKMTERFLKTQVLTKVNAFWQSKKDTDMEITCPACRFSWKTKRSTFDYSATIVEIECTSCHNRFDLAPFQDVDENISSCDPPTYLKRFLTFVDLRVVENSKMVVTIPDGVLPGQTFSVPLENGRRIRVQVPIGTNPGDQIQVSKPSLI